MPESQTRPTSAANRFRGTLGSSEAFCKDLTKAALEGRFRRLMLRPVVYDHLAHLLAKVDKPTVVLTGQPGVGKSSNVYALVREMAEGQRVPADLARMRVLELSVPAFLADAGPGGLEARAIALCAAASAAGRDVLLFIDEAHTLLDAKVGSLCLGDILKPSLARGEICCIAATSDEGYRSSFEADEALARRFQRVDVPEPTEAETKAILLHSVPGMAAKHGMLVTESDVTKAVHLGRRYVRHRCDPDKTNDLLDEALALQRITFERSPDLRAQFAARAHRAALVAGQAGQIDQAEHHRTIARALAEGQLPFDPSYLGQVIHRWTGLPSEVLGGQSLDLASISRRLGERVVGQAASTGPLAEAVVRGLAGTARARGPLASAILLGPTGCGKTETARALAEIILGNERAMLRLDGSEYAEAHSVARLVGAPPGYVGFHQGGELTAFARDHHFGIIVLDEAEKANRSIHDIFLQVLEEGEVQDGRGVRVDLSGQVVIFTSNLDVSSSHSVPGFLLADQADTPSLGGDRVIRQRLADHLRPELVNRFDLVLGYAPLVIADIRNIVQRTATNFIQRMRHDRQIEVVIPDALLDTIAHEAFDPAFGGREVRRVFDRLVSQQVANWLVTNPVMPGARIRLRTEAG